MSDPNAYGPNTAYGQYPQQHGQLQQGQQSVDPRKEFLNYRFSAEELRVIAECERESFYSRSLPFSIGLGTAAFLGVKNGYLKPNMRFGPWPKVIALGFFGYIAGRISYMKKCQEKMMAIPNSRFAEMLRRRKGGSNWDLGPQDAGVATALSLAPFQSATDSYSDEYGQPNSLNLDTSRPNYSGLDDLYHPTMEGKNDLNEELAIPTRKNTVTYDELRQKNRDEYAKSHQAPQHQAPPPQAYYNQGNAPPPPAASISPPAGSYSPTLDSDRRRNFRARADDDGGNSGPKNKYGDAWSE
ncbi:OCIA domain-containing protein 1 [Sitodiplosis mosellana]|uniref:OCIA domain-containing protein 1 n=1 Tax=Sitodiplosis mosellana TaxID=263140 RepID=UPI0024451A9F|nr:OCIA domain-containing protein 1 [Sitodiplosis mosellana]